MSNVREITVGNVERHLESIEHRLKTGGGPPHNGDMEARVLKLEDFAQDTRDRLARIETKLDTFATKEDLHRELGAQTWRIIGSMITLGTVLSGIVYFIARNVH